MKIVPRVGRKGVYFVVRRYGIFGKKYLSKNGVWSDGEGIHGAFHPPILFKSVESARKEVEKQFGDRGIKKIYVWEG